MPEHLTQADYARHRKCSRAAITKAIRAGRIALTADGRVDVAAADAAWLKNTRARIATGPGRSTQAQPTETEVAPYDVSRARREQSEASLSELELGHANGALLDRKRVEAGCFTAARALRDRLSTAAAQLGAGVAPLTNAGDCEQVLRNAFRKLLFDFSGELATMVGPPPVEPAPAAEGAPAK